jgi:hypothetical protein
MKSFIKPAMRFGKNEIVSGGQGEILTGASGMVRYNRAFTLEPGLHRLAAETVEDDLDGMGGCLQEIESSTEEVFGGFVEDNVEVERRGGIHKCGLWMCASVISV